MGIKIAKRKLNHNIRLYCGKTMFWSYMTPIFNIDQSHRSNEDFVSLYQTSNADIEVYNVQSKSWSGEVCLRVQCYLKMNI